MENDRNICCICKTSQSDDMHYLNKKMKMMISKCGHRFCDSCQKRAFQTSREIHCPVCGKSVKKSQLQDKTIEELTYIRELSIRKKVLKDYNKTEEDFVSLDEYNQYLEEIENIIYDLSNGNDEAKAIANKKWKDYRNEYSILIATNDAKKAEDERRMIQFLSEQQEKILEQKKLQTKEDINMQNDLKKQKQQLIEVALGERDASDVVQVRMATTSIPIDQQVITPEMEAAMASHGNAILGSVQPTPVVGGKKGPKMGSIDSKMLRKYQQIAAGYDPQIQFIRNYNEAWSGIFLQTCN